MPELFTIIATILILITLLIATFTDLKRREVPDWLSYSFIAAGIGMRGIFSLFSGTEMLLAGALGLIAAFLVGAGLYYAKLWGGGDAKLLMGMGIMLGIPLPLQQDSVRLLLFFLLTLAVGAGIGITILSYYGYRHRKRVAADFKPTVREKSHWQVTAFSAAAAFFLLAMIGYFFQYQGQYDWLYPEAFVPALLGFLAPLFLALAPVSIGLFYLYIFTTVVEQIVYVKQMPIRFVTEGDWLAKDLAVGGRIFPRRKVLTGNDLAFLHRKGIRRAWIRYGLPFIPSFLVGFVLMLALGW